MREIQPQVSASGRLCLPAAIVTAMCEPCRITVVAFAGGSTSRVQSVSTIAVLDNIWTYDGHAAVAVVHRKMQALWAKFSRSALDKRLKDELGSRRRKH